ncbi:MAG: HlyD family efflux transporter periplasmic adaptor subunit [Phaeodactylibacter sp.]|nr:HlyD family efflux transporter periplasmic adaptor subunit [Phaeodactylibacter sp.]MCB9276028.1 HlyD family efflux transporter periplasmic adaptor subunit [Lewinellaceae bacterium]
MPSLKVLLPILAVLALSAGAYFFLKPDGKPQEVDIKIEAARGRFEVKVAATGELAAKRSVKIQAPQGMRVAGIWETTISDLVSEGSLVKAGDYVASLDRTELAGKMTTVQTEIEKIQTQLEQARIDTAIELRGIRDELVNLGFSKKEKLLYVEQSKYEPQSVIQQAQLDLERTERDFKQLVQKYELKQQQAIAKIQEIEALLRQNQNQLNTYVSLSQEFTINAPEPGMVIYAQTWRGKKEPGSRVGAWDPVVAELPDLSDMISKTYVNEVDISKVQEGQEVTIRVDAFPGRAYNGHIIKVANIGEQLRGYDAKVFEVIVQVSEVDSIMRPAMTTSNEIVTAVFDDAVHIPLEALYNDSLTFVYQEKDGKVYRQEVITGLSNANEIIIEHGLEGGASIYLSPPKGADAAPFVYIEPQKREDVRKRLENAEKERQAQAMSRRNKHKDKAGVPGQGGSGAVLTVE